MHPKILQKTCPTGGCGAKIGPADLHRCLSEIPRPHDPNLLVGYDGSDDAAVYRLTDADAIVSTTDFFPPMVDDPRTFGRIAAANALSDVYAMGGRVLFALNLVCFPETMDMTVLRDILTGGAEKVAEAGAVVAGGHSIYDSGLKYGLAVTGRVDPKKVRRNNACRPGDCLILTKPLGVGLILSAERAGVAEKTHVDAAVATMERLNRYAAEKMMDTPVNAVTDVTGFGLLAHAAEMAGDEMTLTVNFDSIPLLPGAVRYAEEFLATAAGQRNRNHVGPKVAVGALPPARQEVLFDPQTSGGLLLSVPHAHAQALCDAIKKDDPAAAIIGLVTPREQCAVMVV